MDSETLLALLKENLRVELSSEEKSRSQFATSTTYTVFTVKIFYGNTLISESSDSVTTATFNGELDS